MRNSIIFKAKTSNLKVHVKQNNFDLYTKESLFIKHLLDKDEQRQEVSVKYYEKETGC